MKRNNPFNISFGKEPLQKIERFAEENQITDTFNDSNPETNAYTIVGQRGCGKTILLSSIRAYYEKSNEWIVSDLIPNNEILKSFVSSLYHNTKKIFIKCDLTINIYGISFSIKGENKITDPITILDRMFGFIKKRGKKVLVVIDEVTLNNGMEDFIRVFQMFLMKNYPIYLVMTGLYENVYSLENARNLTFLLRTPKIKISPLNKESISKVYAKTLNINEQEAINLSKFTKGYAFAYQLLGSILYKKDKKQIDDEILNEFDLLIRERSYQKIFEVLTPLEKNILLIACDDKHSSNLYIKQKLKLSNGTLSKYKSRLVDRGIISLIERGKISFALPRFKEYLLYIKKYEIE